jgi:nuclear pore complex protein Nup54
MFGTNTAVTSTTPGLFGSNTATSTAPSLFGQTSSAPSLFGSQQQQPSLFGNQTSTSTGPSLFGSTAQTGAPSLFGNTSGTSLFGSRPGALGTGGMFGAQQPTIGTYISLKGAQTITDYINATFLFLGANANAQQQQNQQVWQYLSQQEQSAQQLNQRLLPGQHANPQYIWQSLALIKSEWDPNSPNCKFKHYFYNIVHPSEVQRFTKPPNEDDKAWEMAMKNNPDPTW